MADLVPYDPQAHGALLVPYDPAEHGAIASEGGGVMGAINTGVNWLGTQATKAALGAAGTGRSIADLNTATVNALGLPPDVAKVINTINPLTAVAQFAPTSKQMEQGFFHGPGAIAPEVNAPGPLGKAIDAGTQAALTAIVSPGNAVRNLLPSFVGGASQEIAGNIPGIAGTKYEPMARLGTALLTGGTTAGAQNLLGNVGQGVKNLAPNVEQTAAKLIGRAAERDQTTIPDLIARQGELGPGAPLVEAGGQNVRGTLRGALATPGEARTNAQTFFDARRGQLGDTAAAALDRNISPNGRVAATVEDLINQRSRDSSAAYSAAGVPNEPRMVKWAIDQPPAPNSRIIKSPVIDELVAKSKDVQDAIAIARRLPEFKDQPVNSMAMLDKIYKHIGTLQQGARTPLGRATEQSRDIGKIQTMLGDAITGANPRYGQALEAFSEPSKLIDATKLGKEWFRPGIDKDTVLQQFNKMPASEQEAARVGIRDWARSMMERTDRAASGVSLWSSPANRAKLEAILKPGEYADLSKQMETVKNAAGTIADINVGSRTAPMLGEAADNAAQANVSALASLLTGHPFRAAGKIGGGIIQRVGEGKTEAVNAKIAEMLTSVDPQKVGLVQSLAEKQRLAELARQLGRQKAVAIGGLAVPGSVAIGGGNR